MGFPQKKGRDLFPLIVYLRHIQKIENDSY